jgi:hypothetical protein
MRLVAVLAVLSACGSDGSEPLFAASYASTFVEVRNCRASADHDLNKIRIVAGPTALASYNMRAAPFPDEAIVIKEEYDFADGTCAGPIIQWTVMKKVAGTWAWQKVDKDRKVVEEDTPRCINCHTQCGVPPDGFDFTCAVP